MPLSSCWAASKPPRPVTVISGAWAAIALHFNCWEACDNSAKEQNIRFFELNAGRGKGYVLASLCYGRVAEWLNVPDSKSGDGVTHPWVQIPPLPPFLRLRPVCFELSDSHPLFLTTNLDTIPDLVLQPVRVWNRSQHDVWICIFHRHQGQIAYPKYP